MLDFIFRMVFRVLFEILVGFLPHWLRKGAAAAFCFAVAAVCLLFVAAVDVAWVKIVSGLIAALSISAFISVMGSLITTPNDPL